MNILMLNNRYLMPGGEDVSTTMHVELLRTDGHDVTLVEESNDRVEAIGVARTATRAVWSRESFKRINLLMESDRFDVMHVQNFFPLFSPSVYYAANRHHVPVVQSLRNFRLMCPEGMLFRDNQVCTDCVGKRLATPAIRHGCYRGSRAGSAVIATMSTAHRIAGTWRNRVSLYVTPSTFAAEVYVRGGWDPSSITSIPNFVYPDPSPGSGTGGYALFVGRLSPSKGVETLLAAWTRSEVNFPLKIVGDGPLRPMVEHTAEQHASITYLGQKPSTETFDLMGEASFIVAPTLGVETFGRVAAEALAKGTPGLVSDLGGLREIIDDGATGWLLEPGNSQHLADRVAWMTQHDDEVAGMRHNARAVFLDRFSSVPAINRWTSAYRRVIDNAVA